MNRGAVVSPCGRFRYHLHRRWVDGGRTLLFVMLNPSTADGETDDASLRRCVGFGQVHGFGAIEVVNLFAYRATDPRDLQRAGWPVGPDNDRWTAAAAGQALESGGAVCVAWGAGAAGRERPQVVLPLLRAIGVEPVCLGVTRSADPRHPLYVASRAPLVPFTEATIQEAMLSRA